MFTEALRITVQSTGAVTGELSSAQVTSPEDSGLNTFEGVLENEELTINMWNIFNRGDSPMTWTVNRDRVDNGESVFQTTDCATIADRFPGPVNRAPTPPSSPSPAAMPVNTTASEADTYRPTAADVMGWADRIVTKPVPFEPGVTGNTFEDNVARGEVIVYEMPAAQAGQTLWAEVDFDPTTPHATLSILAPNGDILARDEVSATVLLPMAGMYQVVVAGNQSFNSVYYDISFAIY